MREEEVFERVRTVLVEALNVEPVEVTPGSSLHTDLGAESIDTLDILFRLERTLDIKSLDEDKMFPMHVFRSETGCVEDGLVTAKGLATLRETIPHCDLTFFEKNPRMDRILDIFTVGSIVKYIMMQKEFSHEDGCSGSCSCN